jgi:uncharacterized membrane protein
MDNLKSEKLNKRVLVIFFLIFSGILLPFSGFMLHQSSNDNLGNIIFIPMSFHVVAAIVFTFASIFHIKYNWRSIVYYIKEKKDSILKYRKEMTVAALTLTILMLLAMHHVFHQHL